MVSIYSAISKMTCSGAFMSVHVCCCLPGQLVVCTLCSCVMQTKRIWLFSAHLLPLVARLCLVPLETIVFINKFSMIFTGLEVIYFLASNLLVPYNLAKTAYRELAQVINDQHGQRLLAFHFFLLCNDLIIWWSAVFVFFWFLFIYLFLLSLTWFCWFFSQVVEVYGLLALGMSLWNQLVLPVLFMCFWLLLFTLQIYTYFNTRDQPTSRERLLFLFLTRWDSNTTIQTVRN